MYTNIIYILVLQIKRDYFLTNYNPNNYFDRDYLLIVHLVVEFEVIYPYGAFK